MFNHLGAGDRGRVPRCSREKCEKRGKRFSRFFLFVEQLLNAAMYRTSSSCPLIQKIIRDSLLFDQYQLINFLNSVKL